MSSGTGKIVKASRVTTGGNNNNNNSSSNSNKSGGGGKKALGAFYNSDHAALVPDVDLNFSEYSHSMYKADNKSRNTS